MSLNVKSIATFSSVNGVLIIPPFSKSKGKILCIKVMTPVTNRVSDNKGINLRIHLNSESFCDFLFEFSLFL